MYKAKAPLKLRLLSFLLGSIGLLMSLVVLFPRASFAAVDTSSLLGLHNGARAGAGLAPLQLDSALGRAAQNKANDMLADQYFAHTAPDGTTPWVWIRNAGYSYDNAGENLSIDFFKAQGAFDAWMNSPSHRNNILSSAYSDVGFGTASGTYEGRETVLIVAMFGDRSAQSSASVAPATNTQSVAPTSPSRSYTRPTLAAPPRDLTPPPAPTLDSPAPNSLQANTTCIVSGQAESGARISIYNHENQFAETTTDASGRFSLSGECLDGIHQFKATATDSAGNISAFSGSVTVTVDTLPPRLETEEAILLSQDVMAGHSLLARIKPAEPLDTLQGTVKLGQETYPLTANTENDTFEVSLKSPAMMGILDLKFLLVDAAGNQTEVTASTTVIPTYAHPMAGTVLTPQQGFRESIMDYTAPQNQAGISALLLLVLFETALILARKLRWDGIRESVPVTIWQMIVTLSLTLPLR